MIAICKDFLIFQKPSYFQNMYLTNYILNLKCFLFFNFKILNIANFKNLNSIQIYLIKYLLFNLDFGFILELCW